MFVTASHTIAQYMYVAGLFSNWLLANNPHLMITDWKNFYDQLISALEQSTNKNNPYKDYAKEFLSVMKITLPEKVHFDMRQNDAAEMAESVILMLKQFPSRLRAYLKHRFVDMQLTYLDEVIYADGVGQTLYQCLTEKVEVDHTDSSFRKRLKTMKLDTDTEYVLLGFAAQVLQNESEALGSCKVPNTTKSQLYTLLPHLQRYSNWNMDWHTRYEGEHKKLWNCSTSPEPFSLLPFFKLQPRHINYDWSHFESFMSWATEQVDEDKNREEKMDRDVLAIINFLLCIVAALKGHTRPTHLCRPWKAFT